MSPEVVDAIVRLVSNARRFRVDDDTTIKHLIEMGVPGEHAKDLMADIDLGLQQGIAVAVAGHGTWPTSPPESPFRVAAFSEGHRSCLDDRRRDTLRKRVFVIMTIVVVGILAYVSSR
jgi:hypothetical protein